MSYRSQDVLTAIIAMNGSDLRGYRICGGVVARELLAEVTALDDDPPSGYL